MKTLILAALAALMLTLPASAVAAPRCDTKTTVLQERLTELHYPTGGVDGCAGASTKAAVQAFQKANGLTPDGVVGAKTRAALKAPAIVEPVSTRKARHVEVDLQRQLLVVAAAGQVERIYSVSTGMQGLRHADRDVQDRPQGKALVVGPVQGLAAVRELLHQRRRRVPRGHHERREREPRLRARARGFRA